MNNDPIRILTTEEIMRRKEGEPRFTRGEINQIKAGLEPESEVLVLIRLYELAIDKAFWFWLAVPRLPNFGERAAAFVEALKRIDWMRDPEGDEPA